MSTPGCNRQFCGGQILGNSEQAIELSKAINRAAPFNSTILITGPSGTGKELVARQIHQASPRAGALFVPVDSAAMSGELMASQLFGHVRGAYTSADQGSLGCFRAADQGTLFLDEIGELPLAMQAKLLRVIQERAVVPVGSHEPIPVDVRILAATNRDLRKEVSAGRFREDLYFRLSVVTLHTTALANRVEDILPLAESFLRELQSQGHPSKMLSPGALELLEAYHWPGNVRELRNVLEQAAIETESELIPERVILRLISEATWGQQIALPERTGGAAGNAELLNSIASGLDSPVSTTDGAHWPRLADEERRLILSTLEHTYYNKSAAARLLGVSRQTLIRKMIKYKITSPWHPPQVDR